MRLALRDRPRRLLWLGEQLSEFAAEAAHAPASGQSLELRLATLVLQRGVKSVLERIEQLDEQLDQDIGVGTATQGLHVDEEHLGAKLRSILLDCAQEHRLADSSAPEHEQLPVGRGLLQDADAWRHEAARRVRRVCASSVLKGGEQRDHLVICGIWHMATLR